MNIKVVNKHVILALSLCVHTHLIFAQSSSAWVVSSAGGTFQKSSGSFDWTLGETVTETFDKTTGLLTQGFHQSNFIQVTGVAGEQARYEKIVVYPNPFADKVTIETEPGVYTIGLFDLQGKKIQITMTDSTASQLYEMRIDETLSQAMYILRLFNEQTKKVLYIKIEKL